MQLLLKHSSGIKGVAGNLLIAQRAPAKPGLLLIGFRRQAYICAMRLIKLGIISVIVIGLVLLAISLALPSHVRISRAINVSAPAGAIMPYVKRLDQWLLWNDVIKDSSIRALKFGPEKIETDKITIYSIASVKQNWAGARWVQTNGREYESGFDISPGAEFSTVQWYFDFYFKWYRPWDKFGSIVYDKQMGPAMEKSLAQLKAWVESSH